MGWGYMTGSNNISENNNHQRRMNIALFMAMLENEFSAAVLEGASRGAKEIGANLIVFPVGLIDGAYSDKVAHNFSYQYNVLNSYFESKSLDAIVIEYGTIVSSISEDKKKEFLTQITGDIPVILLSEAADGYSSLCVDNRVGLEEVIYHLIDEHKLTKIGFISGPENNHDAQERLGVFKACIKNKGLELGDDWVAYGNFSIFSEAAVQKLLQEHPDIEAIVCANDHMAIGAYPVLEKLGRKPGKDIFITGFDNIPSSLFMDPSLTTVMADTTKLSYTAIIELGKRIKLPERMFINTHMLKRASCGCFKLNGKNTNQLNINDSESFQTYVDATKDKIKEAEKRKEFETELGNIIREMVFFQDSEFEWYSSVMDILRKLDFESGYIFLYDECVYHRDHTPWVQPKKVNVTAFFENDNKAVFGRNDKIVDIDFIFNDQMFNKNRRYDMLVTPLFFRENQYGYMFVEGDSKYFQFAFHIASQISSTLESMRIHKIHENTRCQLEKTSRSKNEFLENISNELRVFVNNILGMNEMILRENDVPQIDEYASDVKNSASALLSVINNILDFSKIEANKLTIINNEYRLENVLNDVYSIMFAKAHSKKLELNLNYDESLPSVIIGDEARIKQVMLNLIFNAIKYTDEGSVDINVKGIIEDDYAHLEISVSDTGIGIKEDDLGILYDRYININDKNTRHEKAAGIGLCITIGLLELMGSKLEVDSKYMEGSTFSFKLKQKIVDYTPIGNTVVSLFKKKKFVQKFVAPSANILIADDSEISRSVIKNFLKQSQINIHEAENGFECINLLKKNDYDLIFLDYVMPELDGEETIKEIRNMKQLDKSKLPVILISSNEEMGREIATRTEFDDFISKPIDPDVLDALITEYIPSEKIIYKSDEIKKVKKHSSTQPNNDLPNNKDKSYSEENNKELILIVESDSIHAKAAQKIFTDEYDTICFTSGLNALEYLVNVEKNPDLIIIDTQIADINAFRLLGQIVNNQNMSHIPVIMMSVENSRDIEIKCLESGANDFFIKPLIASVVRKRIRNILDLSHLEKHLKDEVVKQTMESEKGRRMVERLSLQSMTAIAAAIDAKDKYTNGHSVRVAKYSNMIATRAGKNVQDTKDIYYIGLLHDVGKIGIPDEIINKNSRLTDEEFDIIKTHPNIGAEILKKIDEIPNIAIGARWHHERYDGHGYPDGLKGTDIPETARIIGVADAYDAMTSNRSYRAIMSQEKVRSEIENGRGTQFDPFFADIMLQIIDEDKDYNLHG